MTEVSQADNIATVQMVLEFSSIIWLLSQKSVLSNLDYTCVLQILQYDMWNVTPSDLWDWKALKEKIAK